MSMILNKIRDLGKLKITLTTVAIALLSITLAGYLGRANMYFELCAHTRVQLLWASVIVLVLQLFFKKYRTVFIAVISLWLNLFEVSSVYISPTLPNVPRTAHLKLLHSNVLSANTHYQKLLDLIQAENPDIVVLEEITDRWLQKVQILKSTYPYFLECPQKDNFGLALFSKKKLINPRIVFFEAVPSIEATLMDSGKSIKLLATHPLPPMRSSYFARRNRQLDKMTKWSKQHRSSPQIIIGDLNITLWSPPYKKLITETDLYNTRQGFGICPSWPTSTRLPLLMIPIDHCLVSKSIKVEDFKTGPHIGSDHLPIVVNLSY